MVTCWRMKTELKIFAQTGCFKAMNAECTGNLYSLVEDHFKHRRINYLGKQHAASYLRRFRFSCSERQVLKYLCNVWMKNPDFFIVRSLKE